MTLQTIQQPMTQETPYVTELARTCQWNFEKLSQAQDVSSGTYTPTLTNTTNISASTAYECAWSRIGYVVTVSLNLAIDPIAAAPTATLLTFTLPIACATTPVSMQGCASNYAAVQTGAIYAVSKTTGALRFMAVNTANLGWYGTFQYVVN